MQKRGFWVTLGKIFVMCDAKKPSPPSERMKKFLVPPGHRRKKFLAPWPGQRSKKIWSPLKITVPPGRKLWTLPNSLPNTNIGVIHCSSMQMLYCVLEGLLINIIQLKEMCRFLVVLIYIRTCLPIFWSFTRINCELLVSLDNNYQYPSPFQNVIYQWDKIIY